MAKLSHTRCNTKLSHSGDEDMARHPNLMLRKGVWYFRRRVPTELVELWGGEFITKSLRTGDYREAVKRLRIEQGEAQKKLDDLQAKATLRSAAELRTKAGQPIELPPAELAQIVATWVEQEQHRIQAASRLVRTREHIQDLLSELSDEEARLRSPFPDDHEQLVGIALNRILASAGFPMWMEIGSIQIAAKNSGIPAFQLSSATHEELYRLVRHSLIALNSAQQRQLCGEDASSHFKAAYPSSSFFNRTEGYDLSQLLEEFRSDPGRGARTEKTDLDYGMVFQVLRDVIGERTQVEAITRDHFKKVRALLLKLPRNATLRYKGKNLVEIAEIAPDNDPRLKTKTINSHLTKVSTIFNWARREGRWHHTYHSGLVIKEVEYQEDGRRSFTIEELKAMFSAPLYTGCVDDERNFSKAGPNKPRRSRFWIPLIALFTGLRQNEICQLAVSDIEEIDGIAIIHVRKTHDWQKLKSKSARRFVPVHPELIRIGFLPYVSDIRRRGHVQLFPELKPDVRGYMSGIFQKRFNTFRHSAGVSDPEGVFHSFRHTWRDALREAKVPEEIAQILGGWQGIGQDKQYGSVGLSARSRSEYIGRIQYAGLDLSKLYI